MNLHLKLAQQTLSPQNYHLPRAKTARLVAYCISQVYGERNTRSSIGLMQSAGMFAADKSCLVYKRAVKFISRHFHVQMRLLLCSEASRRRFCDIISIARVRLRAHTPLHY